MRHPARNETEGQGIFLLCSHAFHQQGVISRCIHLVSRTTRSHCKFFIHDTTIASWGSAERMHDEVGAMACDDASRVRRGRGATALRRSGASSEEHRDKGVIQLLMPAYRMMAPPGSCAVRQPRPREHNGDRNRSFQRRKRSAKYISSSDSSRGPDQRDRSE